MSKGSLGELETYLLLSKELKYLTEGEFSLIENRRNEVVRLLIGLIVSLSEKKGMGERNKKFARGPRPLDPGPWTPPP